VDKDWLANISTTNQLGDKIPSCFFLNWPRIAEEAVIWSGAKFSKNYLTIKSQLLLLL
jgi:hypothetical protein